MKSETIFYIVVLLLILSATFLKYVSLPEAAYMLLFFNFHPKTNKDRSLFILLFLLLIITFNLPHS